MMIFSSLVVAVAMQVIPGQDCVYGSSCWVDPISSLPGFIPVSGAADTNGDGSLDTGIGGDLPRDAVIDLCGNNIEDSVQACQIYVRSNTGTEQSPGNNDSVVGRINNREVREVSGRYYWRPNRWMPAWYEIQSDPN